MSLSVNVEGSVELNHNMLCVYGLSDGFDSGMTECINLDFFFFEMTRDMSKSSSKVHMNNIF
jgi:hypothetical protein